MAITTLNLRALNRSDTASSGQVVTATSATAMDFQAAGGAWNLLKTVTASGASDATFVHGTGGVDLTTYKLYKFVGIDIDSSGDDVNFMMKFGRGLICTSITTDKAKQLKLSPMVSSSTAVHETNFTVSVDAIKNATTGISAKDRANMVDAADVAKIIADVAEMPTNVSVPQLVVRPNVSRDSSNEEQGFK